MSRAHMLYDNQPLRQERVSIIKWNSPLNLKDVQKGDGVLVEGVFRKRAEHVILDSTGTKVISGYRRKYDAHGKEMEPNFGATQLVRTGYLPSSYKTEAKGTADTLSYEEVKEIVKSPLADWVAPSHEHTILFWGEEATYGHVELSFGQRVRLKTKGDTPFIDSLTGLDSEQKQYSSNYTGGEKAGQSWTDKVMGVKETQHTPCALPQERNEGVDEDEWDD